jgi:rhodanese-related sulfurtransferase
VRSNDYLLKRRIAIVSTLDQLYAMAKKRRLDDELPYAGAVLPGEAFQLIQLDPQTRLVDVRTRAELDWIGRPVVGDGRYAHVEWTFYPGAVPNQEFLQQLSRVATSDTPVLFLCRSAVRTKLAAAAAAQAGFTRAFDLLEGFEGDKDGQGHRKTVSGWCFRGLPWIGA